MSPEMVRFDAEGDPIAEDMSEKFGMPSQLREFEESDWKPTCDLFGDLCTRRRARWETWRIAREAWVEEHGGAPGGERAAEGYADGLYVKTTADASHIHEYTKKSAS